VDSPEEPYGDGRNDESVSIKQSVRLGRHIPAEILKKEFLLPGKLLGFPGHLIIAAGGLLDFSNN